MHGRMEGTGAPAPAVSVSIHRPREALQPFITFFYFVAVTDPLTDFLYPEWGNVRFLTQGAWRVSMTGYDEPMPSPISLFGPTDRPGRIETPGGRCIGFGLTPIGWHRLIGGDAGVLANRIVALDDRLGFDARAEHRWLLEHEADEPRCVRRLEALIAARLATRPSVSEQVLAVDRGLRRRPAEVTAFAALAGMSERTLHRVCLRSFGFAPKRLMRLQRFLDTLGQVRSAIGGAIGDSIDGYFDQAHFYRDFREFMDMGPRQYFGAPRRLMAAAAAAQVRAGVTLSFRLPPQPAAQGVATAG